MTRSTTPSEQVCMHAIYCELCTMGTQRGTVYHVARKNNPQCPVWICKDCRERILAGVPMKVEEL